MSRLILTFDDSAAGFLKGTGLADCVLGFTLRFVWGELRPAGDLAAFLSSRAAGQAVTGFHWLDNPSIRGLDEARAGGLGLAQFIEGFDMGELWADHEPNTQLQLIWLLDHLRLHANVICQLGLTQTNMTIGDYGPEEWIAHRPRAVPLHNDHLEIAAAAWSAWRASTPAAWFDLLAQDLSALPQLRNTVLALLEELPVRTTGLGATETRMLELLAAGQKHPYDLFPGRGRPNERRTFGYWEVGELLDGLARGPRPAITGLAESPFDEVLHESNDRHDRYKSSTLALTDLGKAILAGADDFSRHNPIHRWWGGTELANDRLWRWDPEDRRLIAP